MNDDLRAAVAADMPRLKSLLFDLIRMESVSAHGYDPAGVRQAGEAMVGILGEAGFQNTRLLESSVGHPAVFGEIPAPEGAPTLLLYAHYDVQPPGPIDEWDSGPFEPFERDGRIYGRGASDNKAGVVMHLGAVAAHGGRPPVGVQVLLEGEEEAGSAGLPEILRKHSSLLKPDVIVIGDGGNWKVGVPMLINQLRGLAAVKLELRTLEGPVHSGLFGGLAPDALTALARLLATLHNDDGSPAVAGIASEELASDVDYPEEQARAEARMLEGTELIGDGSIASRLWAQPAISVLAIDAPPTAEAINALAPSAGAKVSMRIPPGQDEGEALQALKDHLIAHTPWGAELEFTYEETGAGTVLPTDNAAVQAWVEAFEQVYPEPAVFAGVGGSIPFIATFAKLYPEAPILVIGAGDPTSNIHAPNESQDVGDLERATLSEAIAFRLLADL